MNKKSFAFTLAEMLVVMTLIGIIGIIIIAGVKLYNPTLKGNITKAKRIHEEIDQILTLILTEKTPAYSLEYINDSNGNFSITDNDAAGRLAGLFSEYSNYVDRSFDSNNKYFSEPIVNYDGKSTTKKLNSLYSNFKMSTDGVIWGFRTYNSCSSTETMADFPGIKGKFSVNNICGSIFYDVNAFKKPNRLGYDQFIVPINAVGTFWEK